jgi:peptidoglycan hydrolase CwlO-like protein
MLKRLCISIACLLILGLVGCSTTAAKERLENQNQLLLLEIQNHEHARESLNVEIESLKTQLAEAEQKLKELSQASDDNGKNLDILKKDLASEAAKRRGVESTCAAFVKQVKSTILSGRLPSKAARQEMLDSLSHWQSALENTESARTTH